MQSNQDTRLALKAHREQIALELAEITATRADPDEINDREMVLLEDQDAIEYRLGMMDAEDDRRGEDRFSRAPAR